MNSIEKDFKNWLYRIATWKISDFRRARRAGKRIPMSKTVSLEEADGSQIESRDGLDTLTTNEKRQAWNRIMERLPWDDRQLIVLRYFEGQNYQDIAGILSKNVLSDDERLTMATSLRKRVSRLLDKIRRIIMNEPLIRELLGI